jgi:hypothetical protein
MRTKNLFRTLAIVIMAIITISLNAQLTTNRLTTVDESVANEATDYVTVGARVPYQISGDVNIWGMQTVFTSSVYHWSITGGIALFRINGTTALTGTEVTTKGTEDLTGGGFYNDTIISADFPSTGNYTLSVFERSVSNNATMTGCADLTPEDLNITVVANPTFVFDDADRITGGCGADVLANNNIPVTLSGCNTLQITYGIQRTSPTGVVSNPVAAGTLLQDGDNATFTTGWGALSVSNGNTNIAIPFNITDGDYGTYVVTIQGVTDRISRKSLNTLASYETIGLPVVAQRTFTIYALPTPSTSPIRHISNLAW